MILLQFLELSLLQPGSFYYCHKASGTYIFFNVLYIVTLFREDGSISESINNHCPPPLLKFVVPLPIDCRNPLCDPFQTYVDIALSKILQTKCLGCQSGMSLFLLLF